MNACVTTCLAVLATLPFSFSKAGQPTAMFEIEATHSITQANDYKSGSNELTRSTNTEPTEATSVWQVTTPNTIEVLQPANSNCDLSLTVFCCVILCVIALLAVMLMRLKADAAQSKAKANRMLRDVSRLAMVAERTTNAVVLSDENRNIVWINEGFTRLTGFTYEEAVGKKPGSLVQFEKTSQDTIQKLRTALRSKKGFCGEILNRGKTGREYWVNVDIQPLFNEDGTLLGYLGIESDVTDLKLTTQALAAARELNEYALDSGKLSIWQWNLDTNTMQFDHRFFQITRNAPRSGPQDGSYWVGRIHPDDMARFNKVVADCVAGTQPYFENEFRLQAEDGSYLWMSSRGRASGRNAQGVVNQLMGTLVEITDRKLAEQALRESEAKASAVFNSSIDAIMIIGELRIVDCNQPAVTMFGFKEKQELIGVHVGDLTPEFQASGKPTEQLLKEVNAAIDACGHTQFEWTHLKPDGSTFQVDVSYSNFELDGKLMQLAIVRDISKKKELERQLSQAQKLESIGQLAAGIAHEVNTPMQCVFSNVEFLSSALEKLFSLTDLYRDAFQQIASSGYEFTSRITQLEREVRYDRLRTDCAEAIAESADASDRVIEIVRAMKTMSHPGTAQMSATNLNKLIIDASIISRNRWKYVANLQTHLDESINEVPLLPAQMSQVILNLFVNAADAIAEKLGVNPSSPGTIHARTSWVDSGVQIEISDTGVGMSEKTKERVFDPFFTTKDVGKGTGQGLAIAYDVVVRQHLGKITVESTLGQGTTFRIWLPCSHAPTTVAPTLALQPQPILSLVES